MSWLRDYVQFRKDCPICNDTLPMVLFTTKHRNVEVTDTELRILFMINTFGGAPKNKCSALLRIDLDTLDFVVDFSWTPGKIEEKFVPLDMIRNIKNMVGDDNFYQHQDNYFIKDCECERYRYHSAKVVLNWKTSKVEARDNEVKLERYSVQRVKDTKTYLFEIINTIKDSCMVFYGSIDNSKQWDPSTLKSYLQSLDPVLLPDDLELPSFKSEDLEKTLDKVETYIVFS